MSSSTSPASIVSGPPVDEAAARLTIPKYLRDVVSRFGEREALVAHRPDGVVRWTYQDLWARSREVARALIAAGVSKDTRVGILMTNRPEFLTAMFGTALAGGVTVALNTFSTPGELEHLLQASGVSILLLERHIAGKDFYEIIQQLDSCVEQSRPGGLQSSKFPHLRRLVVVDDALLPVGGATQLWPAFLAHGEGAGGNLVEARAASTKPADTGVLFFSSGTTSLPKGILHAHRAIAVQWSRMPSLFKTKGDVRFWTANGFFWSGNFTLAIGNAFSSGGALVLQSVFNAEEALDLMQAERVTYPVASAHQWARLEAATNYLKADLNSLRYIDWRYPIMRHPSVKTDWRLPLAYGTTETLAINCAVQDAAVVEQLSKECYGTPLPGNTIRIVDPASGVVVARGERGEIAVKGVTLMMGYLGKTPEEAFDQEGYYRTGDGGFLDHSGMLHFEGRLSDIIKTGGANVSPLEVDDAIRAFPGVNVSQTVGMPDELLGEMVVSCVVPHAGSNLDTVALREFLKSRLASFKIPREVFLLQEADIAMTGSNKIKAGALRDLISKKRRSQ